MENRETFGNLRDRPLSFLLFDLWKSRKNGKLSLKKAKEKKILFFEEGNHLEIGANINVSFSDIFGDKNATFRIVSSVPEPATFFMFFVASMLMLPMGDRRKS